MEIRKLEEREYKGSCNGCKNIDHGDRWELSFNTISVRLCKSCLYELEECAISGRAMRKDVLVGKGDENGN